MNPAARFFQVPPAAPDRPVWLHVGILFDGGLAPSPDAHVVYDSAAIRFVGSDGTRPPPEVLLPEQSVPDLEAPDAVLLPGLIEAHAHLFLEGGERDFNKRSDYLRHDAESLLARARRRLLPLAQTGIAAVRDAGDKEGVGLALNRLYFGIEGRPIMPYLDSPGAAIHHQGRYGGFMGEPIEAHPSPQACVEARVAAGAYRIKLIPTGIINFKQGRVTAAPQMTTDEVAALVQAARAFGRQTFAHASGDAGIEVALEGGVDSIEHGFFLRHDQLARMRDREIAWVPTFAPVQRQVDFAIEFGWDQTVVGNLQRILDSHAESLRKAHEMSVMIIAGSDAGSCAVPHGFGLIDELCMMERAGLPANAVLHSATGASAARLGFAEGLGRIAAGCRSRMILTRHSPLDTVANLRKDRTIIFDQEVFFTGCEFAPEGL